tara:strand:- start:71 stop:454 length:384 start_codon:yes stop_codon:yes gene_type:complete
MKMSDNRVAQLIQQLDDAIMMGDDDLIEQIRSDLFREYGIERSGRAEMGLGGLMGPFANGGRVGLREGGISDLMFEALGSDATSNYAKLQMLDALTNFAGSDALFNALGPLIGFRDGGNVGIMSALR